MLTNADHLILILCVSLCNVLLGTFSHRDIVMHFAISPFNPFRLVSDLPTGSLTAEPQNPVFTGETVTLTCVVASYSDWSYQWYKGSSQSPVSQSDRYIREGNTLIIQGAVESDQDHYWCQGEKDTRPTSSHISTYVYLSVTGGLVLHHICTM